MFLGPGYAFTIDRKSVDQEEQLRKQARNCMIYPQHGGSFT